MSSRINRFICSIKSFLNLDSLCFLGKLRKSTNNLFVVTADINRLGGEDDVFIPVVGSFQTEFWNCIIRDKYIQIVFAFKKARPEGSRKTLYFHNKIRETLYQFVAGEELEQASEQYSVIVPIWHNVILDDDNFLEGIFDAFE